MTNKNEAMSLYLAFRYLPYEKYGYSKNLIPNYPKIPNTNLTAVKTDGDIDAFIKEYLKRNLDGNTGILLSGGIDSAILASYLPKRTKAYTIRFIAPKAIDESIMAKKYAEALNLDHRVVDVYWKDYLDYSPSLMAHKKAPLHAIEIALYKAAIEAKSDNINKLIVGNGADSNFGGMDKLLSKDWTFKEFMNRYTFLEPSKILNDYFSIDYVYEPFRKGDQIDYLQFLNKVHGVGIIQAFENAFSLAKITAIEPYENIYLDEKLDIKRIRNGESKYLLRSLFSMKYPDIKAPDKIPFERPMTQYLKDWTGPDRGEFIYNCIKGLTGDQKWLVYCLEWFLNINDL